MPGPNRINDPIRTMLEKRHPDHTDNCSEWFFLRSSMEGGPAYSAGNLYRHELEDPKIFAGRKERSADHHYNLTRLVVDSYEGYLFQVSPTLSDEVPECIKAYHKKAGQDGSSLVDFAKEVVRWLITYGVIWVATDKPTPLEIPADRPMSAQEEADQGLEPYSYAIHPQYMLDGKLENGRLVWCIVQEDSRDDEAPESSGDPIIRYRVWECNRIRVYRKGTNQKNQPQYILESDIPNPIGMIPIIPIFYGETKSSFACPGLVADIAHIDRAIFNKTSLLDEIHYKATFPQLAVPYNDALFTDDGLSPAGKAIIKMGLDSFLPYNSEAGAPGYLDYKEGPARELRESIKEMVVSAVALALLDGESAAPESKEAASGVTKSYIFQKLNKRLATIADTVEVAFTEVFKVVQAWQADKEELPASPLDFPDQFEVKSLTQEITDIIAVLGSGLKSKTFEAEVYKRVVRLAMPKMDEDTLAIIDKEIEEMVGDDYDMQALQNEAEQAGHEADAAQAKAQAKGVDPAQIDGQNANKVLLKEMGRASFD